MFQYMDRCADFADADGFSLMHADGNVLPVYDLGRHLHESLGVVGHNAGTSDPDTDVFGISAPDFEKEVPFSRHNEQRYFKVVL